ncbi:MAG TPA: GxxExxY protein [Tepidisphaeraceae bacterium]|nr:GxxExxY protein [Tepidisphaeraceae bacterium]
MKEQAREFLLKDETYAVVGAAMEVYNTLGPGFLEAVYQEAIELELTDRGIPFESQKPITIGYKNHLLQKQYIADLVCYGALLAELKAIEILTTREESQLINYMKATGLRVGLLLNFGHPKNLDWKRMVL